MLVVRRRVTTPGIKLGDFVEDPATGRRGIVDTIAQFKDGPVAYVSGWDGRGAPPFLYVAARFIATVRSLRRAELPGPVVVRRRR